MKPSTCVRLFVFATIVAASSLGCMAIGAQERPKLSDLISKPDKHEEFIAMVEQVSAEEDF